MTRRLLLVALGTVALAGCSADPVTAPPPVDETTTPTTPTATYIPPTPTTPPKTMDFNALDEVKKAACEQGLPYNTTSPPYAGTGSHWADAYEISLTNRRMQHAPITGVGGGELSTPQSGIDVNLNRVQLLACVTPVLGKRAGNVTCRFDEGVAKSRTWPFYEATYKVVMREALTGREVTVLTVPGNDTPEESCPGFATDDRSTVVARSLTEDALGEALRPLITGTA
jgi:hypothetical protein